MRQSRTSKILCDLLRKIRDTADHALARLEDPIEADLPESSPVVAKTSTRQDYPLYLKVLVSKANKTLNLCGDPQEWAKLHFDLDKGEQSVFRADSDMEEATIVASHYLTRTGQQSIDSVVALRFYPADLERCGIQLSDEAPGDTGYGPVDAKHYDLLADQGALVCLMRAALEDFHAGFDRIRHVGKHQIAEQIKLIMQDQTLMEKRRRHGAQLLARYNPDN